MPHELVEYLNTTKSKCVICKAPNSFSHLKFQHNCIVPDLNQLLEIAQSIQELKIQGNTR